MAKEIQVTATLPALPDGYGPDVHWGPQEDRPHVWYNDASERWIVDNTGSPRPRFHAYKSGPVKRVVWVTAYDNDTAIAFRDHGAALLFNNGAKQVARVRVEFEEGRFDE